MKPKKNKKKKNKRNKLQTTAELFSSLRSEIARLAIFKTGAGTHKDKRAAKKRKGAWKEESEEF